MSQLTKLSLNLYELRALLLKSLKGTGGLQYLTICSNLAALLVRDGIVTDPNQQQGVFYTGGNYSLNPLDQDNVREIIWNLIVEGILTIGMNANNEAWPWLRVTDYGHKVIESETPVPHDPSGYLGRLKTQIPNIDSIIITYIQESLRTYSINCLLSSTITLGCASEKALLILIETYINSIQNEETKRKFLERTTGRPISRQFDELKKALEGIKGNLPGDIVDGLDTVLLGVFEMIRNNRNDAGHPTGKIVEKDVLYANLQVFITYCNKIYQLIAVLSK